MQPPLIAAMAGREGDEYLKLVQWLKEWCEVVPDERAVGLWRACIARVRKQRHETVGTGRFVLLLFRKSMNMSMMYSVSELSSELSRALTRRGSASRR